MHKSSLGRPRSLYAGGSLPEGEELWDVEEEDCDESGN